MERILVLLCLFLVISYANAQDLTDSKDVTNNNQIADEENELQWLQYRIGVYFSYFSGEGFSFQYQFENGFSIKTQCFFIVNNSDDTVNNVYKFGFTYGADLQYNLKRTRNTRLYALVGSFIDYYELVNNNSNLKNFDIERNINAGAGMGVELMVWQNFSIVIEFGYRVMFGNNNARVFKTENEQDVKYEDWHNLKSLGFAGGIGVFYAF